MRRIFRRFSDWMSRNQIKLTIGTLVLMLLGVYFWPDMVISVNAGQRGVLFSRFFGTYVDRVYPEGLHLIPPWDTMTLYNVRLQAVEHSYSVLSKDGLDITVDVIIRFRPAEKLVGRLHASVGPDYVDTVIIPEVGNAVRAVVSNYKPDDLYKASFLDVDAQLVDYSRQQVQERDIYLDDILVRRITLPRNISDAIQRKLQAEQSALEMEYNVEREKQEAERKRVEAAGIRDFQAIIAPGLSNQYLRYKGIEATLELARSPNSKIVVVGTGPGGLPLIFNAESLAPSVPGSGTTAPPVTATAPPPTPTTTAPAGSAPPATGTAASRPPG